MYNQYAKMDVVGEVGGSYSSTFNALATRFWGITPIENNSEFSTSPNKSGRTDLVNHFLSATN